MIKLNDYEEHLKDKKELVYYWLCNEEISYEEITTLYVTKIENERKYYLETLSESDTYVATLIDNNKKDMDYQREYAIDYMVNHKRLEGSKWFENLVERKEKNDAG